MLSNRNNAIESNNAFTAKIEDLVREIVIQNNILFYRIESTFAHLNHPEGEDNFIPVIRIITYFEDTVNQIAEVLHTEFDIVTESSVDKQKSRIESFSYKHIQYLVGFKANRRELAEYKRSGNKKFEIQICSMLQDAWAGIEKELGYDSASFPEEAKRDLYRVGALLEMADIEFLKIRSKFTGQPKETVVAAKPYTTQASAQVIEPQPKVKAEPASITVATIHEVIVNDVVASTPGPEHKVVAIPAVQPIAPQRTMPAQISAGQAPQPVKIEVPEAKAVEPVAAVPAEPQIAGKASIPVQIPQQETVPTQPGNVEKMKVNAGGGIEKAEEVNAEEDSVPFFEDLIVEEQTKAVKPAALDENAPITDGSLKEYVLKSKLLKEIDKQIAERAGAKINPEIDIEGDVERLRFLKVYTLKQLHDRLKDNNADIVSFAEKWIGKDNGGSFDSGISLFYLEYLLVGKKNDPAFAVEYVVKFISDNDYSARYIIPTYNSIRNTEAPNFSHLTLK